MNYLSYLQGKLPSYEITEEVNYNWDGLSPAIVIKYLTGTNYRDSKIVPIQLSIYTSDIAQARADILGFTETYNNTPFKQDLEYIQQIYTTPMLLTPFGKITTNYSHQLVVSAILIVSSNVQDIVKVEIDAVEYETTTRNIVYASILDAQPESAGGLSKAQITGATVKIVISGINKNSPFYNKIMGMRKGTIALNNVFTVKLTYSDTVTVEEHYMKVESSALNSDNQSLPVITVTFIK